MLPVGIHRGKTEKRTCILLIYPRTKSFVTMCENGIFIAAFSGRMSPGGQRAREDRRTAEMPLENKPAPGEEITEQTARRGHLFCVDKY